MTRALHSHMLDEQPRLFFLLAKGLRASLDKTASTKSKRTNSIRSPAFPARDEPNEERKKFRMRKLVFTFSVLVSLVAAYHAAWAQTCKVCAEQRAACMKNYAGPACKTEYQMCMKSCKK
jgi:hypothetical protein